jgi:hypothetical protein
MIGFLLMIACGEGPVQRPFSTVTNVPPELVRSVEDQFIIYLNASGCDIRPPKNVWDPQEDPRHLVTLTFTDDLKLKRGKRGEVIGGEYRQNHEIEAVQDCIDEAIGLATGMIFPAIVEKSKMTLEFPLVQK